MANKANIELVMSQKVGVHFGKGDIPGEMMRWRRRSGEKQRNRPLPPRWYRMAADSLKTSSHRTGRKMLTVAPLSTRKLICNSVSQM